MGIKTELLMLMSGDGRSAWCLQPELGKSESQPPLPLKWGSDSGVHSAVGSGSIPGILRAWPLQQQQLMVV